MGNIRSCFCWEKSSAEGAVTTRTDWIFIDNVKKKLDDLYYFGDNDDYWIHRDNVSSRKFTVSIVSSLKNPNDSKSSGKLFMSAKMNTMSEFEEQSTVTSVKGDGHLETSLRTSLNPADDTSGIRASLSESDVRRNNSISQQDHGNISKSETHISNTVTMTTSVSESMNTAQCKLQTQKSSQSSLTEVDDNISRHMPSEFRVFKQRILKHKASLRREGYTYQQGNHSARQSLIPPVESYKPVGLSKFYENMNNRSKDETVSARTDPNIELETVSFDDKNLIDNELVSSSYI
ncbi:uncharacterized protein LOC144435743 [Glandiceps talaboti]